MKFLPDHQSSNSWCVLPLAAENEGISQQCVLPIVSYISECSGLQIIVATTKLRDICSDKGYDFELFWPRQGTDFDNAGQKIGYLLPREYYPNLLFWQKKVTVK